MKYRLLTLLGVFALSIGMHAVAQDYDDIYYDATASNSSSMVKSSGTINPQARHNKVAVSGQATVRNDDEYNRRGAYGRNSYYAADSVVANGNEESTFSNTQRIKRFYNPEVVDGSGDEELITLYYDTEPTINLVIGSSWTPIWGWGGSSYYDPWYYSWYRPWYRLWGWYPSWNYGWDYGWYSGWHNPWYGWNNPWIYEPYYGGWYGWGYYNWDGYRYGHGWDLYGHGGYTDRYAGGRRPMGRGVNSNSAYSGGGRRPGYATLNSSGRTASQTMGRRPMGDISSRPSTTGGRSSTNVSGGRRPGYATSRGNVGNVGNVGNIGRRPSGMINAGSRSSVVSRGTVSSNNEMYNPPTPSVRSSSMSTTPRSSYSGGSYSAGGGRSGSGNSSHSGGGGFSGGGGRRR